MRMRLAIIVLLGLSLGGAEIVAQQNSQVRNLLLRFRNWRYGMVSVYKVSEEDGSITRYNAILGPREPEASDEAKQCRYKEDIENYVLTGGEGADEKDVKKWMASPGCKAYERFYSQKQAWERAQFKKAYVVTTRRTPGEPFKVIALLVQKASESFYTIKEDVDPPTDIFLENDLQKDLNDQVLANGVAQKGKDLLQTSASTMYEYLNNQIIQGNLENVTAEAQGIGEEGLNFLQKKYGVTTGLTEEDVPTFIAISEGSPQKNFGQDEIIVSLADGIIYRHYDRPTTAGASSPDEIDSTMATNNSLPKYGVELKYGLEDINYPSLWTQRMSLNAVWGATRLGVVLPTNGWASLSDDLGAKRTMTYAGFGVNGAFDFPIRVISESGVFNFTTSYVFGDASESDHKVFDIEANVGRDYLIRYHAALQYSFAIKIDNDFMFRMRLGGTVYGVEGWQNRRPANDTAISFLKSTTETVGGLSGRIDFMTTSWSTPAGFSLSYFDASVLGTMWLQVPIVNQFAVRFDARIFAPVFRDPHAWEQSSVVIPAVRFIYNF